MGRRNDHTREQLHDMALTAASRIISARGLAGLSSRKVAVEIGYTVGSLYLIFKNFDDLVSQVNGRTLDELYQLTQQAVSRASAPRAAILALGEVYIDFAVSHRNRWLAVFQHRMDDTPQQQLDRINQMFGLVQQQLLRLAPKRPAEQVRLAAHALWSGVHGACVLSISNKLGAAGADSLTDVADNLVDTFLQGFIQ